MLPFNLDRNSLPDSHYQDIAARAKTSGMEPLKLAINVEVPRFGTRLVAEALFLMELQEEELSNIEQAIALASIILQMRVGQGWTTDEVIARLSLTEINDICNILFEDEAEKKEVPNPPTLTPTGDESTGDSPESTQESNGLATVLSRPVRSPTSSKP